MTLKNIAEALGITAYPEILDRLTADPSIPDASVINLPLIHSLQKEYDLFGDYYDAVLQGAEDLDNLVVGIGDLYVTVYGGRTRLIGILLGRGLNIDEAKAELQGVTLESLVVAERVAKAIRVKAEKGLADLRDYPLMMHIDEIITQNKAVEIPWEAFTYE